MPFDFHCRYGLFTYAQSEGLDHWKVLDKFTELGAECIIGKEQHADGGTHLHVFADWGRRRRFRQSRFADVEGWHPNVVRSHGTPAGGYDYATKDGDVVAGGLERPSEHDDSILSKDAKWHLIMASETREEFYAAIRELDPSSLAKSFGSISKYADYRYARSVGPYEGPSFNDERFSLEQYPELVQWCEEFHTRNDAEPGKQSPLLGLLDGGTGVHPEAQPPLARIRSAHIN